MLHSPLTRGRGMQRVPAPRLLGIDGGGTKTTAAVGNARGAIAGRGSAGASNPTKVGLEAAGREILRAARAALRQAGVERGGLDAVCLGLAGADRPDVRRPLLRWLRRAVPARAHLLTTDAAIALEAALGQRPGIIVIAGTGSIAYARDKQGRMLRAGGWGVPFGDQGSGYDLGRKGVSAALRAHDGEGPSTRLEAALCRALHLRDITQVVGRNLKPQEPQEIAALAPVVLDAARRGDPVARALCQEAASDLASLALTLLRRLGLASPISVVVAGGVFQSSLSLRRSFARAVQRGVPTGGGGVRISLLGRPPVEGALALAQLAARDQCLRRSGGSSR
ncbi:MAG TPA: BadF/BadG/BcrA/BcrD ATPase family protein [Terriglobia bacterium]|nr:BadF/BadG/BcrA/BcrD ATPase family protein [Terriglobia bacterium]